MWFEGETERRNTAKERNSLYGKKDIQDVIAGIEDHYVLQDAKGIDYLHNVSYDADIVDGK